MSVTFSEVNESLKAHLANHPSGVSLLDVYPVGSIYISVNDTDPGTLFGGTWTVFGAGKTLVGLNSADSDFDTAEETGGSKTHAHAMPHTHTISNHVHSNSNTGNPTSLPDTAAAVVGSELPSTGSSGLLSRLDTGSATNAHAHTHGIPNHVHSMSNTGNPTTNPASGNPSNDDTSSASSLMPYIVVHMFKRVA